MKKIFTILFLCTMWLFSVSASAQYTSTEVVYNRSVDRFTQDTLAVCSITTSNRDFEVTMITRSDTRFVMLSFVHTNPRDLLWNSRYNSIDILIDNNVHVPTITSDRSRYTYRNNTEIVFTNLNVSDLTRMNPSEIIEFQVSNNTIFAITANHYNQCHNFICEANPNLTNCIQRD